MLLQNHLQLSKRTVCRRAPLQARFFRSSFSLRNESANHYEVLGLEPNASAGEIKKYVS